MEFDFGFNAENTDRNLLGSDPLDLKLFGKFRNKTHYQGRKFFPSH